MGGQYNALAGVGISFPIVATVVVAGRFWARWMNESRFFLDDWVSLFGLLAVYGSNFCIVWSVFHGFNDDDDFFSSPISTRLAWASITCWEVGVGVVKISALLLYKRIFVPRRFRIAANTLIGITIIWTMLNVAFTAVVFTLSVSTSFAGISFFFTLDIIDVLLDVATLGIPLLIVPRLHMARKKRLIISAIFLIGVLSVIANIIRIPFRENFFEYLGLDLDGPVSSGSPEYIFSPLVYIWCMLEVDLGLIACCLPSLGPLLRLRNNQSASLGAPLGNQDKEFEQRPSGSL